MKQVEVMIYESDPRQKEVVRDLERRNAIGEIAVNVSISEMSHGFFDPGPFELPALRMGNLAILNGPALLEASETGQIPTILAEVVA